MKPSRPPIGNPKDRLESIQLEKVGSGCTLYGVGFTRNTGGISRRSFLKSGLIAFAGISGLISMQGCSGGSGGGDGSASGATGAGPVPEYMILNRAHESAIRAMSFNASGSKLATADDTGVAKVWEVSTGKLLLEYTGHKGYRIEEIRFDPFEPFGNRIASCGWDKTVKIWDSQNGQTLFTYGGHDRTVYSLAFSPDGTKLACAGKDIHMLGMPSGGLIYSYTQHGSDVVDLSFSADSQLLASLETYGKEIHIIDANDGSLVAKHKVFDFYASAIAFSHRGVKMAAAGTDLSQKDFIRILNASTGETSNSYQIRDSQWITAIDFASDDQTVAVSDWNQTVILWTIPTNSVMSYLNHATVVHSVAFSPDNVHVASGDYYGVTAIWDRATGKIQRLLSDPKVAPVRVAITEWTKVCQCDSVCTCDPVCACLAVSTCPSDSGCSSHSVCSSNVGCPSQTVCTCDLVCTCNLVYRSTS